MFDWLYFWNLIWSFFALLALVFVPVCIAVIYFVTRAPRARSDSSQISPAAQQPAGTSSAPLGERPA